MENDALTRLTEDEITEALVELQSGWHYEAGSLLKSFTFDCFAEAADFVAALGEVSDDLEGHHPDQVLMRGSVIELRLATHSVQGVSQADLDLAEVCDALVEGALTDSVADQYLGIEDDEE